MSPGPPRAATCPTSQTDYARTARATPVAQFADGSFIYSNAVAADAGCVTPERRGSLYGVVVAPGGTYRVKSDGGTTIGRRVEVEFTNTARKERVSVRMEAGRSVIT